MHALNSKPQNTFNMVLSLRKIASSPRMLYNSHEIITSPSFFRDKLTINSHVQNMIDIISFLSTEFWHELSFWGNKRICLLFLNNTDIQINVQKHKNSQRDFFSIHRILIMS